MLIALTGATGFLGRYVVRQLVGEGHRLRCWHRPESDRSGFDDVADSITWQLGELGQLDAAEKLVRGVDAVVHAAVEWQGPGNRSREALGDEVLQFLQRNVMGSLMLFQSAFALGVPRFVFVSSCAVHDVILGDRPLDETHPLWPLSHYGAQKAALEKFVHSYGLGKNWNICSLRPTGIYGLAHPPAASRWYDLVGQVLNSEPIATARGGKEVHVADVARAISLLLGADATRIAGQAFNCYDRYISEQEVAQIAARLSGRKSDIKDLNRGPKNQIVADKLKKLGMTFGGAALLERTVRELIAAHSSAR